MKTVIEMAREAGWKDLRDYDSEMHNDIFMGNTDSLKAFAELVRADEREHIAAWMIQRGYSTGHGDTTKDLLDELDWQVVQNWTSAMKTGVETEREACAKLCEDFADQDSGPDGLCTDYHAHLIRARGETK